MRRKHHLRSSPVAYAAALFSVTLLFSLSTGVVLASRGTQCENDMEEMYDDHPDLEKLDYAFWDEYNDQCQESGDQQWIRGPNFNSSSATAATAENAAVCAYLGGIPRPRTRMDVSYSPLEDDPNYFAFVEACEGLGEGYRVCTVSNVHETDDTSSIAMSFQPVCLPPECTSEEMDDHDWAMALNIQRNEFCDTKGGFCKFTSIEPHACASGGTSNSSVKASEYLNLRGKPSPVSSLLSGEGRDKRSNGCVRILKAMMKNNARHEGRYKKLTERLDGLNNALNELCTFGNHERYCSTSFEPVSVSMVSNFAALSSEESYTNYRDACALSGGTLCTVSLSFFVKAFDPLVEMTVNMNDVPLCFPPSCVEEMEAYEFFKEVAYDAIAENAVDIGPAQSMSGRRRYRHRQRKRLRNRRLRNRRLRHLASSRTVLSNMDDNASEKNNTQYNNSTNGVKSEEKEEKGHDEEEVSFVDYDAEGLENVEHQENGKDQEDEASFGDYNADGVENLEHQAHGNDHDEEGASSGDYGTEVLEGVEHNENAISRDENAAPFGDYDAEGIEDVEHHENGTYYQATGEEVDDVGSSHHENYEWGEEEDDEEDISGGYLEDSEDIKFYGEEEEEEYNDDGEDADSIDAEEDKDYTYYDDYDDEGNFYDDDEEENEDYYDEEKNPGDDEDGSEDNYSGKDENQEVDGNEGYVENHVAEAAEDGGNYYADEDDNDEVIEDGVEDNENTSDYDHHDKDDDIYTDTDDGGSFYDDYYEYDDNYHVQEEKEDENDEGYGDTDDESYDDEYDESDDDEYYGGDYGDTDDDSYDDEHYGGPDDSEEDENELHEEKVGGGFLDSEEDLDYNEDNDSYYDSDYDVDNITWDPRDVCESLGSEDEDNNGAPKCRFIFDAIKCA